MKKHLKKSQQRAAVDLLRQSRDAKDAAMVARALARLKGPEPRARKSA